MNNIAERVKQYFSSNFGKLDGIISILSFIVTFILSVLYKNRIDISLLKGLLSGIITLGILFLIGMLLKRYLGDVIESSNSSTNMDIDYNPIDDNSITNTNAVPNADNGSGDFNPDNISISPDSINVDKKPKTDYHSSGGDIGDIISGKPSFSSSTNYSSSTSSMFADKKVSDNEMRKEVQEDPEKVAKAVRTMMAKDEKDDK
ncbi:hypothetical protein [Brachyspira hampsonii]|uniref:Uncharacterized protein n=1 Tax=Brachyspira hampsonii TaxID=1287055 RepID=A0AAC9TUT5_9SPIR|nr:hypothetical protein [Brachyspira hampsonii]ASJ22675.1 hypothetical protein BHAMNSH16_13880 [Brachyspira hampsonii]ELV05576.1 hypothetical protein H263_09498 [Brachyspira hampsonii 30599]MBW5379781.1 hypothetical protein [Brachyspira hampsonii]MBW5410021.1 hypothetical protein [Brachyspira hampsonii]OEJ16473.1 hypothetical protein A9496_13340 [Brachyspira hampsonii]